MIKSDLPRILIISNAHRANDVRLYHKLGKSLCKIACVYVLGARGVGNLQDDFADELPGDVNTAKPVRIIVSGVSPIYRLFSLYTQSRKLKPDVVICIEPLTMLVGILLRKRTKCRLVYDAHEYYASAHAERYSFPLNYLSYGLYLVAEKYLQRKMDLTIAVNEDIYQLYGLQDAGSKTRFPHNGIVIPNYPTRDIWKDDLDACSSENLLPDIKFDTIYLGGLSEARGILKLLQAIDLLHDKYPQLKALFVGKFISEEFKTRFFDFVMDQNLNSHVFWREAVAPDKVCAILRQVKIGLSVLHPNYKRYRKALPLKVLEYLAAGLPVVANDFPQLKDILLPDDIGKCTAFHKQDIAKAIAFYLNKPEPELQEISLRCRQVIRERYLWDTVEPQLLQAVSHLLDRV